MAKDKDNDALGANQSKKAAAGYFDFGDQPQQQHPPQQHRVKSQKHVVGGGRLHARVPSSKGLQKHHAATTTKLNRKHGSLSPERGGIGAALAHHHRRATSELKLTHDPSSTNLKKDPSQTNLKRNRSQVEVGKRTKSSTSLHRSVSNPAVSKLRSSGSSRVQFNLGEENQEEEQDDDEWVDASTSASPLLSRRGSAVSSAHTASHPADDDDDDDSGVGSPTPRVEIQNPLDNGTPSDTQSSAQNGTTNGTQYAVTSLPRTKTTHNQYLTSRILSRTPSHGAPPMMSAETASARPSSIRQPSPPGSSASPGQYLSSTPGAPAQVRPGSSGKAELTSRFVGNNSQEPGSGLAGESFILAANRGGLTRAPLNGKDEPGLIMPKRRQSLGALSQARGIDALKARQAAAADNASDEEEEEDNTARSTRSRRSGEYVVPREMNRTQQKLNLQRASSSLEPSHPHPGIWIGQPGVAAAGPLIGVPTTYDSRDPRIGKTLERTGTEYLTVRRHLNPIARSISRVMQLPGYENSRRIPQPSVSRHASRLSEQFIPPRDREPTITRNSSMADLINGNSGRRPPTPRSNGGGAFSTLQSASSSLDTDDDGIGRLQQHERLTQGHGHGLSGSSLLDGAEDAGTVALLRMMWEKNLDLGASQD
jgi:hypothetical protein